MSYNIDESPLLEVNDIESQISCQESQRNLENTTPSPTSSDSDESCKICYEVSDMIKLKCGHEICKSCLIKLKKHECPWCRKKFILHQKKKIVSKNSRNNNCKSTICNLLCVMFTIVSIFYILYIGN